MLKINQIFLVMLLFLGSHAAPGWCESAKAVLKGTDEGSPLSGVVSFKEEKNGLKITAEIDNAPLGRHGFHIHEFGDCADAGKAAGGHYNPDGVRHGLLAQDGFLQAHAGDLGNMEIGPDGTGKLELLLPNLSLGGGKYTVGGRSVILHEKEDDFGQPAGNAGARIACGEILLQKD